MKIAVIGANSTLGRKVVNKAEEKGINVVGMVRTAENLVGSGPLVLKDYHSLEQEDLEGCHYVVDTVSFPHIDRYSTELLPVWRLLEIMKDSAQKLLCVGSCSFLYTDKTRQKMVLDDSCLCSDSEDEKSHLRMCVNAFRRLGTNRNVHWGVLCPPLILDRRGYGAGNLEFGNDIVPMGLDGNSSITLNEFANAVIELLLRGFDDHQCISVRSVKD
ncbi:MAG: hypothetical protein J6M93_07130 [Succinivibrio sp.]|nr:hypothetical protein [Succinivibrio sp.]